MKKKFKNTHNSEALGSAGEHKHKSQRVETADGEEQEAVERPSTSKNVLKNPNRNIWNG